MTIKNLTIKNIYAECVNIREKYQSCVDIKDLHLKKKLLIYVHKIN